MSFQIQAACVLPEASKRSVWLLGVKKIVLGHFLRALGQGVGGPGPWGPAGKASRLRLRSGRVGKTNHRNVSSARVHTHISVC
jgi:hypothetical protein